MIVIVASNDQLTTPKKDVKGEELVMVLPTGKVILPSKIKLINKYCRNSLVSFNVPDAQVKQDRTDYQDLEKELRRKYSKDIVDKLFEMLAVEKNSDSKYVNIVHLSKPLKIPWGNAYQIMVLLMKWGAYSKYRNEWRRNPQFLVWLKQQEEY